MDLTWTFPLPRTHTGILQGNARLGAMTWGAGNVLNITLGRADFWDHRGGTPFTDAMSYRNIRRMLESGDESGIRDTFRPAQLPADHPERPTLLPVGRLELLLPVSLTLTRATLNLLQGDLVVSLSDGAGAARSLRIDLSMEQPLLAIDLGEIPDVSVRFVPAWDYPRVRERLGKVGFAPPRMIDMDNVRGFSISTPADGAGCLLTRRVGPVLFATVELGRDADDALDRAQGLLRRAEHAGRAALIEANRRWWQAYWSDVPGVSLPDAAIAELYHYGMYKFAGLTNPLGVAAGLQGPWIEEYDLPPWSGDYHFNINVQMCYAPAYPGNRLEHLRPLFDLVWSWLPQLRDNARKFVGIDDGLMLPHAVDDRCTVIGNFWTGTMDHACTAWVGKMMFDYWRFGGDDAFLRDRAYPFMLGALRVFMEMLERRPDGSLSLPVSVSPEYRGSSMNAWGRDASFQLAAIHMLVESLQAAARALGITPDPGWQELRDKLPLASIGPNHWDAPSIALWDGLVLEESHRHHSHLAGITPFDVIDPADPSWAPIVKSSFDHWIYHGMGLWSGWCMPWAAQLHTRVDNADMAVMTLEIWRRVFVNEGRGTLHDCNFPGLTLLGAREPNVAPEREIMQMDAGMGAVRAIFDLLLHERRGVHHLFAGCPRSWRDVSFDGIRTAGGFLVSGKRVAGSVREVQVAATNRAGTFTMRNPFDRSIKPSDAVRVEGSLLHVALTPGQSVTVVAE